MRKLPASIVLFLAVSPILAGFGKPTDTVYGNRTVHKYHGSGCRYLKKSKIKMTLKQARSKGLTPCSRCNTHVAMRKSELKVAYGEFI